jgi:hypothetical protein
MLMSLFRATAVKTWRARVSIDNNRKPKLSSPSKRVETHEKYCECIASGQDCAQGHALDARGHALGRPTMLQRRRSSPQRGPLAPRVPRCLARKDRTRAHRDRSSTQSYSVDRLSWDRAIGRSAVCPTSASCCDLSRGGRSAELRSPSPRPRRCGPPSSAGKTGAVTPP